MFYKIAYRTFRYSRVSGSKKFSALTPAIQQTHPKLLVLNRSIAIQKWIKTRDAFFNSLSQVKIDGHFWNRFFSLNLIPTKPFSSGAISRPFRLTNCISTCTTAFINPCQSFFKQWETEFLKSKVSSTD